MYLIRFRLNHKTHCTRYLQQKYIYVWLNNNDECPVEGNFFLLIYSFNPEYSLYHTNNQIFNTNKAHRDKTKCFCIAENCNTDLFSFDACFLRRILSTLNIIWAHSLELFLSFLSPDYPPF